MFKKKIQPAMFTLYDEPTHCEASDKSRLVYIFPFLLASAFGGPSGSGRSSLDIPYEADATSWTTLINQSMNSPKLPNRPPGSQGSRA